MESLCNYIAHRQFSPVNGKAGHIPLYNLLVFLAQNLNIYTLNTPSPTPSTILDKGISMVNNKFTFLTYLPFPTQSNGPKTGATDAWSTIYMY